MKLFSKRNTILRNYSGDTLSLRQYPERNLQLIRDEVRNRIASEIRFLSSNDDFMEWFLLFDNQKDKIKYFDSNRIDSFSLAELGYKMTDYFEFDEFKIIEQEKHVDITVTQQKTFSYFDDYKLFDLIEVVILFSKSTKRSEIIVRFNTIFIEEGTNYQIVENLITKKSGETIKNLTSLLKDDNLSKKIVTYYDFEEHEDFINSAKISADIINILFSGYIKDDKSKEIGRIKDLIAQKIVAETTKKTEKSKKFVEYLENLLSISKTLTNEIYDVRHSEKSTIKINNQNIYKLISYLNMSIAELVLTSLKDDYVLGDNWEKIKMEYIKKYNIDTNTRLIREASIVDEEPRDDIPF